MTGELPDLEPRATTAVDSEWRRIVTKIPVPDSIPLIERLRSAEPRSMGGMPPIVWHEAEGFLVRDPYGNQWIDLTSGIMIANAGHSHPRVRQAICAAVDQPLLLTYAFPSRRRLDLLERLVGLSPIPDSKAILFFSGTEATECAIMLMRRRGAKQRRGKVGILSFEESYHGRTLAAWAAGGRQTEADWIARDRVSHFQVPFPFCPRCPWGRAGYENCGAECFRASIEALERRGIGSDAIAGVIFEPLPGWATWPIPRDYARALKAWADVHEILLTSDEVQTGCGRTGRFFGFEHLDILPDLVTLGKGLSSSLPVSAVIGRRGLLEEPAPGEMSSTHGGNPVCAAAAWANLGVIEEERLVGKSAETGARVLEELRELGSRFPDRVLSVHGRGLFVSVHFRDPATGKPDAVGADAVVYEAIRRGVLMFVTGRGFLKVAPPLSIDPEAAMEAVRVVKECASEHFGSQS